MIGNFLTIPLYSHKNENEYIASWDKKFNKAFGIDKNHYDKDIIIQFKECYLGLHPRCYINDIVGYAILNIQKKHIEIEYYLNCDKRKKYNKDIDSINSKDKHSFRSLGYVQGSTVDIFSYTNEYFIRYFTEILNILENQCEEWNIYFDKESYVKRIGYFNFEKYWNDEVTNNNTKA